MNLFGITCTFIFIVLITFSGIISGQSIFQEHVIIDGQFKPEQPRAVFTADVDSDGDNDVLYASHDDNKIAWYETQPV